MKNTPLMLWVPQISKAYTIALGEKVSKWPSEWEGRISRLVFFMGRICPPDSNPQLETQLVFFNNYY